MFNSLKCIELLLTSSRMASLYSPVQANHNIMCMQLSCYVFKVMIMCFTLAAKHVLHACGGAYKSL